MLAGAARQVQRWKDWRWGEWGVPLPWLLWQAFGMFPESVGKLLRESEYLLTFLPGSLCRCVRLKGFLPLCYSAVYKTYECWIKVTRAPGFERLYQCSCGSCDSVSAESSLTALHVSRPEAALNPRHWFCVCYTQKEALVSRSRRKTADPAV